MTQAKKRVAIFASGTGSNFQALADALTVLSLVLRSMLARLSLKQPF